MTTLDTLNIEALYVPGMRFWKQATDVRVGVVAQNANGAVEIWHATKDPAVGAVIAHSPAPRVEYVTAMGCTVLGGTCHARESYNGYALDFYPLLVNASPERVLQQIAAWHDELFAGTRVTA